MNLRSNLLVLGLMAILMLSSCSGTANPVANLPQDQEIDPGRSYQWHFGEDTVVELMAGQHMLAGYVTVSNDYDNLYVTYETIGDWMLRETHLHVASSYDDFPTTKKGNPKVGHFNHKMSHNPPVNTYTYTISLDEYEDEEVIVFAAHAVVQSETYGQETGWAGCEDFPGKNWAVWCSHTIGECEIDLPPCEAGLQAKFYYPGAATYWDVELFNVPEGFDVQVGIWPSYCIEQYVYAYPNTLYNICLISSDDENLPSGADGTNWKAVTYILNHEDGYAVNSVQQAIWHYTDGYNPTDPGALELIAAADEFGDDFDPQTGDVMAVIVFVNDNVQLLILEVTIECQ